MIFAIKILWKSLWRFQHKSFPNKVTLRNISTPVNQVILRYFTGSAVPLFNFNILKNFYYFYIQIHFAYQVLLATKNYLINLSKNKQPNRFRDIYGSIWVLAYCKIQSRQGKQFCMSTNRDPNTYSQKYDSNYRKEQRPIFCIPTAD